MYNEGNLTRWSTPTPGGGLLTEKRYNAFYNVVEFEVPMNNSYGTDMKTHCTALLQTRTFVTRGSFDTSTLKVYLNGVQTLAFDTTSVNTFVLRPGLVGFNGFIWVKYSFKSSEIDKIYSDIGISGVLIRRIGMPFNTIYLREICDVISLIEQEVNIPETLWLGGKYNNKFSKFELLTDVTPILEDHFLQIADSINNVLEIVSRNIGMLNLNDLLVTDDYIPKADGKIFCGFIERCRAALTRVEEVLISL